MKSVINILQNDSALTTLIGGANQIGMNVIGQAKKTPYVVVDIDEITPTKTFREPSDLDFVRVSVFSVADLTFTSGSIVGADDLGDVVRDALDYVAPGTYDGEIVTRCVYSQGFDMQEDRIANKRQITREDEYLLSIRPFASTSVSLTKDSGAFTEYSITIQSNEVSLSSDSGSFTDYGVSITPVPVQLSADSGTFTEHGVTIAGASIQLDADSGAFTDYAVSITPVPIQLGVDSGSFTEYSLGITPVPIQLSADSGSFTEYGVSIGSASSEFYVSFDTSGSADENNDPQGKYWNNITTAFQGSVSNIVDKDNVASTIDVIAGTFNSSSTSAGVNSPDSNIPDEATISFFGLTDAQSETLDIEGLDNGKTYDITIFAGRGSAGNRTSDYTVDGDTQAIDASPPGDSYTWTGISPTSNEINITMIAQASNFGYINYIKIVEN